MITGEFLDEPNITADTIGRNQNSNQKPYYQTSKAPQYFRLALKLPFLLVLLALLTAVGIVFIAPTKRRGWRRVGIILAEAGIVLVASKLAADTLVNKLSDHIKSGTIDQLSQPRDDLLHRIESHLFQFNLIAGIVFLVIAVAIFVYLFQSRDGRPVKSAKPAPVESADEEPESSSNANNIKLAPPSRTPKPINNIAAPPPKPTTAPTLKKAEPAPKAKPAKPKKLPLIQG